MKRFFNVRWELTRYFEVHINFNVILITKKYDSVSSAKKFKVGIGITMYQGSCRIFIHQ